MNKLLSIVIPVYKVEKYIYKCVESVIVSDDLMAMLEIIIVNDGTPDKSADMVRPYAVKYPESIRIIDKENGGHGSAWNVGLKEATGKYIRFLDSDDWLTNVEDYVRMLKVTEEDMIYTNVSRFYEDVNEIVQDEFPKQFEYGRQYSLDDVDLSLLPFGFWNWTYKTSLLQKYVPLFAEHVYYDDAILFFAPMILSSTFRAFDMVLYNYRLGRPGQTMSKDVQKRHATDYAIVSLGIVQFVNSMLDRSADNKLKYVKQSLASYLNSCFNWFLLLNYKEYKPIVGTWLLEIGKYHNCYNKLGNRIGAYQKFPSRMTYLFLKGYMSVRD